MLNRDVEMSRVMDGLLAALASARAAKSDMVSYLIGVALDEAKYDQSQRKELCLPLAIKPDHMEEFMTTEEWTATTSDRLERLAAKSIEKTISLLNQQGYGTKDAIAALKRAVHHQELANSEVPDPDPV